MRPKPIPLLTSRYAPHSRTPHSKHYLKGNLDLPSPSPHHYHAHMLPDTPNPGMNGYTPQANGQPNTVTNINSQGNDRNGSHGEHGSRKPDTVNNGGQADSKPAVVTREHVSDGIGEHTSTLTSAELNKIRGQGSSLFDGPRPHSLAALSMIDNALRHGWHMNNSDRKLVVDTMLEIIRNNPHHSRRCVAAAKVLIQADGLNARREKIAVDSKRDDNTDSRETVRILLQSAGLRQQTAEATANQIPAQRDYEGNHPLINGAEGTLDSTQDSAAVG